MSSINELGVCIRFGMVGLMVYMVYNIIGRVIMGNQCFI